MDIHELFEQHYSEHNAIRLDVISGCRLSNGSYNNLSIARAFRMFKAGYDANKSEKPNVTPKKLERTMKSNHLKAKYTAVDMTTAAAQGFRDGQASVVVDLEPDEPADEGAAYLHKDFVKARIIAAGGSVKE